MIKRALLTIFVLATFAAYSFHQHDEETAKIVAPSATTATTTTQTTAQPTASASTTTATSTYKDGQYTGTSEDAFYGFVKVKATITGGKIVSVEFLSYPNDQRNSVEINYQAMPLLQQEAIKAQSSKVDIISGATDTSQAFVKSLSSALNSALAT